MEDNNDGCKCLRRGKKWLDKEICKDLLFKVPPNIESVDTKDYIYKEVTPKSFIMYPSFEDKFPSVTVQFNGGEIGVIEKAEK